MNTLKAEKRDMSIKAKRLRREGFVTGNVFGKEIKGSIPVRINRLELDKVLKSCVKGSQVMLDVDGQEMDVLIKEIDFDSMKNQVEEIDFQALVKGEKVHSVAEVILRNHEEHAGGIVEQILGEISYKALPEALVDKVEIDVAKLRIGDSVRVKDLEIASRPGISLITDPEAIVVVVSAAKNADLPETETAGEETAKADK